MKLEKKDSPIVYALMLVFVACFALICLMPFYLVLIGSFTQELEIIRNGYSLFPAKFSIDAYRIVFMSDTVLRSYEITFFITITGTVCSLLMIASCAYALSVRSLRYRKVINILIVITMLFSGGLTPWYILVTRYLHLGNTLGALIIPSLFNAFYMFIMRSYFQGLPDSIRESATIDGANEIYILYKIILPISKPIIATIGLFVALNYWNDWFNAIMFIDNYKLNPLQLMLRSIISNIEMSSFLKSHGVSMSVSTPPSNGIRMAATIVTLGPIILLYPFAQKYFVKGLVLGSVKG